MIDEGKLNVFTGQMLGDLGAPLASPWCVWGARLAFTRRFMPTAP